MEAKIKKKLYELQGGLAMINIFFDIVYALRSIEKLINYRLISKKEIKNVENSIMWIQKNQEDMRTVMKNVSELNNNSSIHEITEVLADLGKNVGDLKQSLDDLDELLAIVAKRYTQFLDANRGA